MKTCDVKIYSKIKIGIYEGEGSGENGITNFTRNFECYKNILISKINKENFINDNLSSYNTIVFTGGSGSKQAKSIGIRGRSNIKRFVESGGNYIGICAGAYLALSGFDWSLGLINAKTISTTEWERGKGYVDVELTKEGLKIFTKLPKKFKMRYSNGPLLKPISSLQEKTYTVLMKYKSEISQNNVTPGIMKETPVAIFCKYGLGNVFVVGTHPEDTIGLSNYLPHVVSFLNQKDKKYN